MQSIGFHYLWDIQNVDSDKISFKESLVDVMTRLLDLTPLTVEGIKYKQFEPIGVTGIYLLSESHLSIHTWPEHNYLAIDLFSCVPIDDKVLTTFLIKAFESNDVKFSKLNRGIPKQVSV